MTAEIGDFIEDEYRTIDYLRPLKLMHEPTEERLHRTMEYHKAHVGMSPSESDITLLDTARKVEFYGIRLHFARNHEGLGLNLAVSHLGILIFQNLCRISTFSWAKIRKLSFKRKRFLVKLQPERFDVIEFLFDSRDECKQFWKNCIEHHAFFRYPVLERNVPAKQPRNQPRSGSTFR
ncbi:FERM, RhoGEF and pleckstrin domain protein 2 [Paragonimus westermani]|uniref:FERM, RhoGEF and pleckstrin domain protein 2 n=1 Tax=Paragonimus westermani TaxID=34504 RepID=A0A5J4NQJ0_9TREM|nr:FERM, RhoGEF and pleckstrin domain protein 2 [Paragonimus westermani]